MADDHPVFRKGLCALLTSLPEATVVAEAADGEQAVQLAATCTPDVVVMDLNMPEVNGVEATRRILADRPGVGVLVLTMFEDDDSVFAAMRAGALGYLVKGSETEQVVRAITAVGNTDIAKRLFLSPKTIRNHVSSIFTKLQVADRAQVIVRARAAGLGIHPGEMR